jgi:hypothetical protein
MDLTLIFKRINFYIFSLSFIKEMSADENMQHKLIARLRLQQEVQPEAQPEAQPEVQPEEAQPEAQPEEAQQEVQQEEAQQEELNIPQIHD